MKILLVEDNKKIAQYTNQALSEAGHVVDVVYDGQAGEQMIRTQTYDVILLDIMLPYKDGMTLCAEARDNGVLTPIILLTARDAVSDKIQGLDSGADDYMIKPFAPEELLARIRSVTRRPVRYISDVYQVQDVKMDMQTHTVYQGLQEVCLTQKEFTVLEYLLRNAGTVVSREQILEHCWDFAYDAFSNIVDVYIKQLRKKLGNENEKYIKTIRGVGYQFKH